MPKVEPIRVFDIPSESQRGETYKVQYDGTRWFCECRSWRFNLEHKGEKDADGKAVPRECKHTRRATGLMQTHGAKAYRTIQPIGPWYEELQEYVARLVDFSRNGKIRTDGFAAFRADLERFRSEREKVSEALDAADTMLELYVDLLKQISEGL